MDTYLQPKLNFSKIKNKKQTNSTPNQYLCTYVYLKSKIAYIVEVGNLILKLEILL